MLQLLDRVIPVGTNMATKIPYERVRDVVSGKNLHSMCNFPNSILESYIQNKMNKTLKGKNCAIGCLLVALFLKLWCIYY